MKAELDQFASEEITHSPLFLSLTCCLLGGDPFQDFAPGVAQNRIEEGDNDNSEMAELAEVSRYCRRQ